MTAQEWIRAAGADLAERWRVRPDLGVRGAALALVWFYETGDQLTIISGYRTPTEQLRLERQGRPTAPVGLSTHTEGPPAAGFDVQVRGGLPTDADRRLLGSFAEALGLRWGGGSPVRNGIPTDWNHFDLGPRSSRVKG